MDKTSQSTNVFLRAHRLQLKPFHLENGSYTFGDMTLIVLLIKKPSDKSIWVREGDGI